MKTNVIRNAEDVRKMSATIDYPKFLAKRNKENKELKECLFRTLGYLKYLREKWSADDNESTYPEWILVSTHIEDVLSVLVGAKVEFAMENTDEKDTVER